MECVFAQAEGGLRVALALGYHAGMRISDALKFTWSGYDGSSLEWTAQKNKETVWIAVTPDLKDILDAVPQSEGIVVLNTRGKPYTQDGFRTVFYRLTKSLEKQNRVQPGLTFHGLRRTLACELADNGATTKGIQAALGDRSIAMAELYADEASRKTLAIQNQKLRQKKTD